MKDKTRAMYPLRRLIELKEGSIPRAAAAIGCGDDMVREALRHGEGPIVMMLAAECVLRRLGPMEVRRAMVLARVSEERRGEFFVYVKPHAVEKVHECREGVLVSCGWHSVGAIEDAARFLDGTAERVREP